MPLFSIITISFNEVNNIEFTVKSVVEQTFCDYEYVVIDGASTDGTFEKEREILENSNIHHVELISERDAGIYNAMNKGISKTKGKWLLFLNAGDSLAEKNTLEQVAAIINESSNNDIGIFYGDSIYCYQNLEKHMTTYEIGELKHRMCFSHQSAFVRSDIMKNYMYDEEYRIAADYDFFVSAYIDGVGFAKMSIPVSRFTIGGISSSGNCMQQKEHITVQYKHGLLDEKNYLKIMSNLNRREKKIAFAKMIIPGWILELNRRKKLIRDGYLEK